MARLTLEQVRHVGQLAALALTETEVRALCDDLGSILDHIAALDAIDVRGVEPTFHPVAMAAPLREDQLQPSLPQAEALAAAPEQDAGGFVVPKVLEGDG